jgi:hypothetical protein
MRRVVDARRADHARATSNNSCRAAWKHSTLFTIWLVVPDNPARWAIMRHFMVVLLLATLIALAFSPVWLPRVRAKLQIAADDMVACPHCELM